MREILVVSVNDYGEWEWTEKVEAKTWRGVWNMACKVVRGCGADPKKVHKVSYSPYASRWFIDDRPNAKYPTVVGNSLEVTS